MARPERTCPRYAGRTIFTLLLALALTLPGSAAALNTRVSIAHYRWSNPEVRIDLGEKVTWDWLGPDLAHSITGVSPNARQWDSDPRTDAPFHRAGHSYTLQFTQPDAYVFHCKLHPAVRGEVIVSEVPGDPSSDPGPQPPLNIDVTRPTLDRVVLGRHRRRGGAGLPFSARVSERGRLEAEYYRLGPGRKRAHAGFKSWRVEAGVNRLRLGRRWRHFEAEPGRYEAMLRAVDRSANVSRPVTVRFAIAG